MAIPKLNTILKSNPAANRPGQGPAGRASAAIERNQVESHLGNNTPPKLDNMIGLGDNTRGIRVMPG